MRTLGSLVGAHARQLQHIEDHPNDVTVADIEALVSGFDALSSFAKAAQPLLDAPETASSRMKLN